MCKRVNGENPPLSPLSRTALGEKGNLATPQGAATRLRAAGGQRAPWGWGRGESSQYAPIYEREEGLREPGRCKIQDSGLVVDRVQSLQWYPLSQGRARVNFARRGNHAAAPLLVNAER